MSDALDAALAVDEARYRDPVVKSDVVTPPVIGAGGEPITEPVEKVTETRVEPVEPPKPEDDADKERTKRNRDAESARWARMTAKLGDADRDREQLRADKARLEERLARLERPEPKEGEEPAQPRGNQPLSQADFDKLVEQKASAKVAEERQRSETAAFNAECNRVAAQGEAAFGKEDFDAALSGMFAMAGSPQIGAAMIEAALETDNPSAVLYHLGKNPADVMRLVDLKPTKLGAAVAKIANTLATPAVVAKPEVSRAPAPLEPVTGSTRADAGPLGPRNMDDWIEWDAKKSKRK